jgi:hypothetical protein
MLFKNRRETWHLHSASKLWESLLNDTKQHSKYHQVAGEICSKYVADKFDDIIDDIKRIFAKVIILFFVLYTNYLDKLIKFVF